MTTPLELLRRPFLKGPAITQANSSPDQWAGRTTLSSGSATVTVSTRQVNSDSLIWHGAEGNANVASGTNRVTEVKTISSAAYFTLGTQDGQAIPRDTILMWEIRKTT